MQASAAEFVPSFLKATPTKTLSPYAVGGQGPQNPTYNTKQTTAASLMWTVGICSMIALDAYSDDDDEDEPKLCEGVESTTANQKDKAQPVSISMKSPCPSTCDGSNASCSGDSDCETSDQEPSSPLLKPLEHVCQPEDQACQSIDIEVDAESTRPWRKRSWMAKQKATRSDTQVVEAHFEHAPWRKESAKKILKAAPWRKIEDKPRSSKDIESTMISQKDELSTCDGWSDSDSVPDPPDHVGQPDEPMSIQMLLRYRGPVEPQHRTKEGLLALEMGPPESDMWAESWVARQNVAREMVLKDAPWCGDTNMIISPPPGLKFSIRVV